MIKTVITVAVVVVVWNVLDRMVRLEHAVEWFGHPLDAFMDGRPGELQLILGRTTSTSATTILIDCSCCFPHYCCCNDPFIGDSWRRRRHRLMRLKLVDCRRSSSALDGQSGWTLASSMEQIKDKKKRPKEGGRFSWHQKDGDLLIMCEKRVDPTKSPTRGYCTPKQKKQKQNRAKRININSLSQLNNNLSELQRNKKNVMEALKVLKKKRGKVAIGAATLAHTHVHSPPQTW